MIYIGAQVVVWVLCWGALELSKKLTLTSAQGKIRYLVQRAAERNPDQLVLLREVFCSLESDYAETEPQTEAEEKKDKAKCR